MISLELMIFLFILAFFAGIGISAIGPGGIFVTIGLFLLVPITSAEVAGTASLTFVATGILATLLYQHSGDFSEGYVRETSIILSGTGTVGAFIGSQANLALPDVIFGYLLSIFVTIVGGIIVYRDLIGLKSTNRLQGISSSLRRLVLVIIGVSIGFIGGFLGVGGPVIAVPVLVLLGIPMLGSLAIAQVQSIFISGFATIGYWSGGAVSLPLALLVGIPQVLGVVVGWRIAHSIEEQWLRLVLGVVLVIIAPVIAF